MLLCLARGTCVFVNSHSTFTQEPPENTHFCSSPQRCCVISSSPPCHSRDTVTISCVSQRHTHLSLPLHILPILFCQNSCKRNLCLSLGDLSWTPLTGETFPQSNWPPCHCLLQTQLKATSLDSSKIQNLPRPTQRSVLAFPCMQPEHIRALGWPHCPLWLSA